MPVANVADRAPAFNIPATIGFGNDIFEVRRLVGQAIDHARSGKGPYLVEFKTFRRRGHGEHDDMGYVPADLRDFWERRDPLHMLRSYLLEGAGWTTDAADTIDAECSALVERAVEQANALPEPKPETVSWRLFSD
jgi:TPP-dependent pyruvate/acetoin dehydrogenase alpha subunit